MERIHLLQQHPLFRQLYDALQKAEESRPFCRHNMEHFLAVARLMRIYNLEEGAGLSRDLLYGAALLHDLGRAEPGTSHEIAGAEIAGNILPDCGFEPEEIEEIREAILGHRSPALSKSTLRTYLYRADKASRNCFCCPAREECNWPREKMNLWIQD
ncbi:MAG: HD domain-containing protein [Faecousia sp.]